MNVLDLFAGPGGWDVAARQLGLDPLGIEWDNAACKTREAAGLRTEQADVAALDPAGFAPVDLLIASLPCQDFSMAGKRTGIDGDRGQLVREVLRWTDALRPMSVVCEQVPPVLEIWQHFAHVFRGWGYSAWAGILNAADYGVPQTRQRAILIARRDGLPALPPEPTHCRGGAPESMFGPGLEPWVSMAQALGWDENVGIHPARGEGMIERHGERRDWPASELAPTVISKARSWTLRSGQSVAGEGRAERELHEPSVTVTGRVDLCQWVHERPSTTVQGDPRIGRPGHKDRDKGEAQFAQESVRVTVEEAAALQSFPPDYPWRGSRSKQFEQLGNAIPPRLAARVLAAVLDLELEVAA